MLPYEFFFLRFVFTEVAFLAERSERESNLRRLEFEPSLSIRLSTGLGEKRFTSLPFSLPFFPFSPETPDTQASLSLTMLAAFSLTKYDNENWLPQLF